MAMMTETKFYCKANRKRNWKINENELGTDFIDDWCKILL